MISAMIYNLPQLPTLAMSQQTLTMLMPMTMTMLPASMDDDDDSHCDDHCLPINLLALQQEIQQTILSINKFFTSLSSAPTNHACNNDQPIGQ